MHIQNMPAAGPDLSTRNLFVEIEPTYSSGCNVAARTGPSPVSFQRALLAVGFGFGHVPAKQKALNTG
ncbi:MAG: hypothetical protein EBU57_01400 [Alphaproteobacteria bacterium]|jgi:hypothetical protein|nr:hypothetical protein [Alphaproteobacteria bacterium]